MPELITNPEDIHLQEREELNYFLGNPPSWMLRNGVIALIFIFGLLLFLSYLIKYPDTVTCRVVLTTEQPPIRVLAQTSGRVSELLVKENEIVEAGKNLAVFENTAEWRDVLRLETILLSPPTPKGGFCSPSLPLWGSGGYRLFTPLLRKMRRTPPISQTATVWQQRLNI